MAKLCLILGEGTDTDTKDLEEATYRIPYINNETYFKGFALISSPRNVNTSSTKAMLAEKTTKQDATLDN